MNRTLISLRALLLPALAFLVASGPARARDASQPAPTQAPAVAAAPAAAQPTAAPAAAPAPAITQSPVVPMHEIGAAPASEGDHSGAKVVVERTYSHDDGNAVAVGDAVVVKAEESVPENAVAVMGSLEVDGVVWGNAVAVMGPNTVNGTVHGNVVAVMGDVTLGPKAEVFGNVVPVLGNLHKSPTAKVHGNTVPVALGAGFANVDGGSAISYWNHCLRLGRPIGFGPHLHLVWLLSAAIALITVLLSALFPAGISKCIYTLRERPGITVLTGFLAVLGLPVLGLLLLVTVIGIPVAVLVLPLGVLVSIVFGRAAIQAVIGRAILGQGASLVMATLLGAVLLLASFLVPFLGFAVWFLVSSLGFALSLTALFTSSEAEQKAAAEARRQPPAPAPAVLAAAAAPAGDAGASGAQPEPPRLDAPAAHAGAEVGLPRAGFWIRMVALFIDATLCVIIFHAFGPFYFIGLGAYAAVLWKLKGSTLGGMIFHLKVVRVDGQAMDWPTAVVRAFGCFLSMVFACLGFIWIGFDREKQAWHDKIAGTVVVRHPKGVNLV